MTGPPEPRTFGKASGPPPKPRAVRPGLITRLRGLKRWQRLLVTFALTLTLLLVAGGGGAAFYFLHDLPKIPEDQALWATARAPGMAFEDKDGTLIATRGAKNGYRVRLAELPPYAPQAFLAAEDRRYYEHGPVDLRGILRALFVNTREGETLQGGSTITQQIAKTLFLTPDRTWKRKIQEAILASRLERQLGKDGVLELYLNRVFFGSGAYGLDAAAQTYFGVRAHELTLAQVAILAAIPKAPSRLALNRNMDGALGRSHSVLAAMRESGWITARQERGAIAMPPSVVPPRPSEGDIGYVLDMAAAEAERLVGPNTPDLIIRLTIDVALQDQGQQIVREVIATQGRGAGASQAALVAMTPDGAIRAIVGGTDHRLSPFNRATQARRQPGSSFKPLIYAAALEAGVSPADIRVDKPARYGAWRPANYGGGYAGSMTVETALIRSVNTIAVRLGSEVGRAKLGNISRRFGLTTIPPEPDLPVALGAYEVSLLELTGAFQVFQNAGERRPPYLISQIITSAGDVAYMRKAEAPQQVYQRELAGSMVRMMKGVVERGTAKRAALGRPSAGKTGTSQNWRDAWFIGFTPDWAAGVWVGNDNDRPMNRVTGGDLPAQIWRRFMTTAHQGLPVRDFDFLPAGWASSEGLDEEEAPEEAPEPAAPAVPQTRAAVRDDFYSSLADDFAKGPE